MPFVHAIQDKADRCAFFDAYLHTNTSNRATANAHQSDTLSTDDRQALVQLYGADAPRSYARRRADDLRAYEFCLHQSPPIGQIAVHGCRTFKHLHCHSLVRTALPLSHRESLTVDWKVRHGR